MFREVKWFTQGLRICQSLRQLSNTSWLSNTQDLIWRDLFLCCPESYSHLLDIWSGERVRRHFICLFFYNFQVLLPLMQEERHMNDIQFSSVQSLSRVRLFATPWVAAHQASLSITNSWNPHRFMSIESVMPSSHLILCHPLLLLPPIPPSIRVFSNESTLQMTWPKYWSFSFSIIPSK